MPAAAAATELLPQRRQLWFSPLRRWRTNGKSFPAWATAARIAFAISPNSAACERVFALLKSMFGEQQVSSLADILEAALMLRYNGRRVG